MESMGWKYLKDKTWSQVTRDERFFCQRLYQLIKGNEPAFVKQLNALTGLSIPCDGNWEVGFEVCFYRDLWHLKKDSKPAWPQGSPKRTFDLCLFSAKAIVIIEAKAQQGFDSDPGQLDAFAEDREGVKVRTAEHGVENVYVIALASSKYLAKPEGQSRYDILPYKNSRTDMPVFDGAPITWADLEKHFGGDEVLQGADAAYDADSKWGKNNAVSRTGEHLLSEFWADENKQLFVGRGGGLETVKDDRDWRTRSYETSPTNPKNRNWISLKEFIDAVQTTNENS